jgi:GT2 family glycosyltransferase
MIDIISATRMSETDFWNESALGRSLQRLGRDSRLVPRISFVNQRGLPEIYNERITAADGNDVLVFIHDDVWIDDIFFGDRVIEGLRTYDVIGVAGNRRIVARQPSWLFMDKNLTWDDRANLSGAVAHGKTPCGPITLFGTVPADCELLDGVFLAAKKSALTASGALFDPRFSFHFYDLDFCRTARRCGLRLGTWPICLTHQSGGAFGSAPWVEKYYAYIAKWESQDRADTRPTGLGLES